MVNPSSKPLILDIDLEKAAYSTSPPPLSGFANQSISENSPFLSSSSQSLPSPTLSSTSSSSPALGGGSLSKKSALAQPVRWFRSLRRLLKRNPSTVVGGRYTINLYQGLALTLLGMSVLFFFLGYYTSFWFFLTQFLHTAQVSASSAAVSYKQWSFDRPDKSGLGVPNKLYVPAPFQPLANDTAMTRRRWENIRGRGTKSSLKKIQFAFKVESAEDQKLRIGRLQAVKEGMQHAWTGYKTHAWGMDEVNPVTGGGRSPFNGWGATMIDSLDTLLIMGMNQEFDEALEWVQNSFQMNGSPHSHLQFFETTIRYLGGLLSAYDLSEEPVLLEKAKELGDYLMNAFKGTDMPRGRFTTDPDAQPTFGMYMTAEVGTIQLEFTRLSQLTGDPKYEEKARKVVDIVSTATMEMPGLVPQVLKSEVNARYSSYHTSVGGMIDSYYEYLLKEWILLDGKNNPYGDMFQEVSRSIHKYMVSTPEGEDGEWEGKKVAIIGSTQSSAPNTIETSMEHLSCFIAGSLAMGSKYYDRPEDLELAQQVAEGCYQSYNNSVTGLGPERFAVDAVDGTRGDKFKLVENFYTRFGRTTPSYVLRPETVESLWILYRLTGDVKYQDQGWEIFKALERNCRTDIAYSGLHDVNRVGSYNNNMESFFLAETMKYLYLLFTTPDVISLDSFVLNTEAHPIKRTL